MNHAIYLNLGNTLETYCNQIKLINFDKQIAYTEMTYCINSLRFHTITLFYKQMHKLWKPYRNQLLYSLLIYPLIKTVNLMRSFNISMKCYTT